MNIYEYWIGQGVDFAGVWKAYDEGEGYKGKFSSMEVHLIQLTFRQPRANLPLFNHEAVFKTIKGYFHELKRLCLSDNEYGSAGPLFLYEVSRGSSVWSFLGELRQLLLFGVTLVDEKLVGQRLDNVERKLRIMREYFGGAVRPKDFEEFMRAKTPRDLEQAVQRMVAEGLQRVEISRRPFSGNAKDARRDMIDVGKTLRESEGSQDRPA